MSQPYIGDIRMFAGNFAPAGWMFCEGQLLPISEFETLFNLIGTTYGGDGQSTFGLPDMRGRLPIHQGNAQGTEYVLSQSAGVEQHALAPNEIPSHNHPFMVKAATDASMSTTVGTGQNQVLAAGTAVNFSTLSPNDATYGAAMDSNAILTGGNGLAHDNFMPYLCVNFIIALFGVYPTQN
jgi:microcystin-dependent protein